MADDPNFTALLNSDHQSEAEMRAVGKVAEADALRDSRATRSAQWRSDLGLPAAAAPIDERAEREATDRGQALDTQAGDYRVDIGGLSEKGLGAEGARELTEAFRDVAVANKLQRDLGNSFIAACIDAAGSVKGMDVDQKANYADACARTIETRAGSKEAAQEWTSAAKAFLGRSSKLNHGILDHLARDPLVVELAFGLNLAAKGKSFDEWRYQQKQKQAKGT